LKIELKILTPLHSLLRKEGRSYDNDSKLFIKSSENNDYLSGMMHNMQYIKKYPPLYEVERGKKGVSTQAFRIIPR
jgi:hypothetical protein